MKMLKDSKVLGYDDFCNTEIGTVVELVIPNGQLCFTKCSDYRWLVEFALANCEPFPYIRFVSSVTGIEAHSLYDTYSKK